MKQKIKNLLTALTAISLINLTSVGQIVDNFSIGYSIDFVGGSKEKAICKHENFLYYAFRKNNQETLICKADSNGITIDSTILTGHSGGFTTVIRKIESDDLGNLYLCIATKGGFNIQGLQYQAPDYSGSLSYNTVTLQFDSNLNFIRIYDDYRRFYGSFHVNSENQLLTFHSSLSSDTSRLYYYDPNTGVKVDSIIQVGCYFSDIDLDNNDNIYAYGGITSNTPIFESYAPSYTPLGTYNIKYNSNKSVETIDLDSTSSCIIGKDKIIVIQENHVYKYSTPLNNLESYRFETYEGQLISCQTDINPFNGIESVRISFFDNNGFEIYSKGIGNALFTNLLGSTSMNINRTYIEGDFMYIIGDMKGKWTINGIVYEVPLSTRKTFVAKVALDKGSFSSNQNNLNTTRLDIYPNPFIDFINIESENRIISYKIYDVKGTLVNYKDNFTPVNNIKVDCETLKEGSYILILEEEEGKKIYKKIIKN